MTKSFWAILAVIAVVLGGIFVVSSKNNDTGPTASASAVTKHITGSGSTGITLQEYGDYQCPICGTFYPVVKQVEAKYKDQIYFQFSNLPLTSLHPNAFAAARAAEAAGMQDKYFEMNDVLYQNQQTWSSASSAETIFTSYAQQLGLNSAKFKQDFASTKVNTAINADVAAFKKTGNDQATPTFFLDGKKLNNTDLFDSKNQPSLEKFSALIDAAIAKKKQ
ncbi:MAG: thioredoxin domain-containing protein [Candidatus Saccharimonadales bacterium]